VNFSHIPKFKILGCDKTTPLKGISPQDCQSRKEMWSRNGQNGIWIDEGCTIHLGVLSFCHSHLVDSSSGKVLPGSHGNRVGIMVKCWNRCLCWGWLLTSVEALISIMALLSTFETSCGFLSRRWLSSGWSPLNTLTPSVWSYLWSLHYKSKAIQQYKNKCMVARM
jgi:hypothetical protein